MATTNAATASITQNNSQAYKEKYKSKADAH
jgi:hypothetical protein